MRTIYETQLPQTFIREKEEDATLVISAKINEKAHIAAEPSTLAEVIQFHRDARPNQKLHIIAVAKNDALDAIEARINFTFDNQEYLIVKMNYEELLVLQLSFATSTANDIARRYIAHVVRQRGAIITQEDVNTTLLEKSSNLDEYTLTHTDRIKSAISNKVSSIMSVTNLDNIDVRKVQDGDEVSVDEMLQGGIFVNRIVTGGKKTIKATELLERADKGMYVCHRRTIASANVPFAVHYENVEIGSESRIKTLKTVVNSITKGHVQEFVKCKALDVLVIDEVAQVLRHLAYGSFNEKNSRVEAYNKLKEAIAKAQTIYVADADANDRVINFIRSVRGNEKIVMFESENRDLGVEAVLKEYKVVEARALTEAKNGKAFVAVDNAKFVAKHARKLVKDGKTDVLGLTADNIKNYSDLLADTTDLKGYGSLLFSPAITSSVSILNGDYSGNYGLFSGNIIAGDAVQMLRRDRIARQFTVGVKPNDERLLEKSGEILAKQNSDMSEFDIFAAKIEAEDNYIRNNITTAIVTALELAGFSTRVDNTKNEEEQEAVKAVKSEATQEYKAWKTEELLKALSATKQAITEARENGETTQDIAIQKERAELERAVGTSDVVEDDITKAWKEGALTKHIRNLEIARMSSKSAAAKTYNEKKNIKASRDRFDYAAHNEFFNIILSRLNIDLDTLQGSFTTDAANALGEVLHASRATFNKLSLRKDMPKTKPQRFTSTARELLRELGIETDSGKTTRQGERMVNTFTVKADSAVRLQRYLSNRASKSLTI